MPSPVFRRRARRLAVSRAAAANIPAHLDAMEQSNRALNDQIETVTESLGGFAEMREKAVAAFPEIQRNIENMTDNLRESVEEQTQAVSANRPAV